MSEIAFIKMHAHGDDFALVDGRKDKHIVNARIVRQLGDRHTGIGFNQLGLIEECDDADARLTFFNPDGSTLGACGSATRGAAELIMRERRSESVKLRTERGVLLCRRQSGDLITVDMGAPLLDWREVPLAIECDTLHLPISGDPTACSMGNPHCTFFVDDLAAIDPSVVGPPIEQNALFPEKTNVHFVQVLDRNTIRLRIWERGGGVPLGSGSCSCGAAVAAIRRNLTEKTVRVICDGGSVHIEWLGHGGVQLTGSVSWIYQGSAFVDGAG
jgi:diaminopimelate epimerase